jgi:NTP pyrophosphatase (non-canonical NTP hydrolase)
MTFDQYQAIAATTAQYKDDFYPIASLMVESAELSDLFIKPRLRGDDKRIDKHDIISEAGDVLWNLAMLLRDNGIDFSEVAEYNLSKLRSRSERGVIQGSGGDR